MQVQMYVRDLLQDLKYSLQLLRRAPGFTAVSIATLALGVGASTSMFTIIDSVLLRPLSFAEPHRLVMFDLATAPEATTYFWFPQNPGREITIVARSVGNPSDLATPISEQVSALDPSQPVADVRLMRELVADDLARPRFTMLVLVAFAATALLLAMIGLYGLISFIVVQRTHEIGVRMALGAQQRDVLRLVMYGGLRLALAGIVIGVAATVAITRVMAGLIYGVRPTDPITQVTVTSVVTAVALFATYVPGRRATRLDPTVALGE